MYHIALCYLPISTVASTPESVFALEGRSVTLMMKRNDSLDPDRASWTISQSEGYIVKYYPRFNESRVGLKVSSLYKDRVKFDNITLSLRLQNLRKNDSGLYIGEINGDIGKTVVEYRLYIYGKL